MAAPEVPIDVDPETGVWRSDGLPMLYVPRHFFMANHKAVEDEIGAERYAELLYPTGYQAAYAWCDAAAPQFGLRGSAVLRAYLQRLSQRGWGLFHLAELDPEAGRATVRVDHSAFVYFFGPDAGRLVDYMFTGWLAGAMAWVAADAGYGYRPTARQLRSGSDGIHDHGLFEIWPSA